MQKRLIVNADDFGLSNGVNRGIIETAEHGILTSASLMVRQPAAAAAGDYARAHRKLSVGLHLDLGEWVCRNEEWVALYSVVPTDDAAAVAAEIEHQLAEFQRLVGRAPTHLDSHQHVHRHEPVRSLLTQQAHQLGIPLREVTPTIAYCGDFYGQTGEGLPLLEALTLAGFKKILSEQLAATTELGCHPGYGDGLSTSYRDERAAEIKVLCAPETRAAVTELGFELCSFSDIMRA